MPFAVRPNNRGGRGSELYGVLRTPHIVRASTVIFIASPQEVIFDVYDTYSCFLGPVARFSVLGSRFSVHLFVAAVRESSLFHAAVVAHALRRGKPHLVLEAVQLNCYVSEM